MLLKIWVVGYLMGLIGLYFVSRKHQKHFSGVDQKIYPIKGFLCIGYCLLEMVGYKYNTIYDQKLVLLFNQIYGGKEGKHYTKIHWCNQVTFLLIIILLLSLFTVAQGMTIFNYIILSIVVMVAVIYGLNKEVYQQLKRRQEQIKLDLPEFLSKLILLISAGLNVSKAWERIAVESDSDRPLYKELRITLQEIKNGKSEEEAYEDFANRCRNPEIFKFVSLIIQNLKKGNEEIISMLRLLNNECWITRKNTAKILGEEASTKLLLPLMIMFIAILMIVMTPAILALMMM